MADRVTGSAFATRSEIFGAKGMVATSQPLAAQVGIDILKIGGNAADAAIAVNACLGLMEPTGCGIGGDLFVMNWDAHSGQLYGLNGSGRSAINSSLAEMREAVERAGLKRIPEKGALSVSIPGCVDGWFRFHQRFGKLPIAEVLAPAIHYAEEGFPLSEVIAYYWERSLASQAEFPGFLDTFSVDGNRAPKKGECWKNPALADTYRALAEEGSDAFYKGERARKMAEFLEENGSFIRCEDFARCQSEWVDPISTNYRAYDVWELPPNGQGLAALQILNILEEYDLAQMGFGSADHIHAFIEAKKHAFADRARLYADPDFGKIPVQQLLSKEYADAQRKKINPDKAATEITPDPAGLHNGDTVYLSTADKDGNMVSFIQSNYHGMGSGLCPPDMGFAFQTRGSGFTLEENHANVYAAGKRPFHTIIPAFITKDNHPLCAFGVMGGDTQPQAHAQIVMNLVDFGMNLQEAGDAPRIVHSGDSDPTGKRMTDGGSVFLESGFTEATLQELTRRGHKIRFEKGHFGGYQAIWRDPTTGVYAGASESRKDGQAIGY
jgi:gamma-glutamyltranspeptidase/glutathione hydrolase